MDVGAGLGLVSVRISVGMRADRVTDRPHDRGGVADESRQKTSTRPVPTAACVETGLAAAGAGCCGDDSLVCDCAELEIRVLLLLDSRGGHYCAAASAVYHCVGRSCWNHSG